MIDLREYGWNDALDRACLEHSPDLVPARVVAEHRDSYRVRAADGEFVARTAGRLRYAATTRADLPAVGDWVLIAVAGRGQVAVIQHVLPRFSWFSRKMAGFRTEEQIVASNIDVVWLANALDRPLSKRRIERYLALAWESGATPVILLTKSDLAEDIEDERARAESVALGVAVHVVSSVTGAGLSELGVYLRQGQTVAILGASGAGKSTLINRLLGREILPVAEVRAGDHKGRHITTHRQLIPLPGGGLIVDTPGMRELQLWDAEVGVKDTFGDIEELAANCRFADCRHAGEPACAVLDAVERGRLDQARLESYQRLEREQAYLARRLDARSQADDKRKTRAIMKSMRHHPKYRK